VIRVAAVGDVHLGAADRGACRAAYEDVADRADVLLLAGDLTRLGTAAEARVVGEEFADLGLPVVAVLGNHDHHSGEPELVCSVLRDHGLTVLEGEHAVVRVRGETLGVAGAKGFGGGFVGRSASNFGEQEMKDFATAGVVAAEALEAAFDGLQADHLVALTHYSPTADTLVGEPPEIHAFLGSYLLAKAVDDAGADLAIHGHAHHGTEHGLTDGGVRVRNVARPVLGRAYALYHLGEPTEHDPVAGSTEDSSLAWGPGAAGAGTRTQQGAHGDPSVKMGR